MPQREVLASVEGCIDDNCVVPFQNSAGMSVNDFLSVLGFYLKSTLVSVEGKLHVQRRGVHIGSSLAPVLCNIFLVANDKKVLSALYD